MGHFFRIGIARLRLRRLRNIGSAVPVQARSWRSPRCYSNSRPTVVSSYPYTIKKSFYRNSSIAKTFTLFAFCPSGFHAPRRMQGVPRSRFTSFRSCVIELTS